ncbi:dihydroxyacetone kinase [Metschnikowia bicuspidata var. bicuspidata NRRL YB-4993]|uniref:Dihydroxyacetone kinase n=1 Tax=Metschnikowia bicuspidata var. bicuspidata NRRL YB-4993 TaxID=869754 RepID=A0A1A0HKV6_9ASCO|nr:dihydroxyacetone kinase [Metschnikowia bicuspidata var. bicuspidata NRRL YB-4993]OBA24527.1 dihydroxyacetone kinase [Metschnikowia bicuspidata var. bicuspidata NRRL YB-4993]
MAPAKHWKYPKNEDIVLTALKGLVASNPNISFIPSEKVVFVPNKNKKVAVISGGGAGHEPLHSGFVGNNLLDAAVSGAIFASPSTKQIMAAVKATADKERGAVIIVKNYTGDVLHFGLVAERAKRDGFNVELVSVSDDVAVGRTQNKMVGRRGLAGTAIVHKVVGAAAATGATLPQVAELGRRVNDSLVTMSASLDRTSVPGREEESEHHEDPTVAELGLGIHNEPGQKIKIPEITDLVDLLFERLLDINDKERHYVNFESDGDYVLLVNNIGGTSTLELLAITQYAIERCPLKKKPLRVLVSDFVTSLNSPGFSITLLNVDAASTSEFSKKDILGFLDEETDAPGWKPKAFNADAWSQPTNEIESPEKHATIPKSDFEIDGKKFKGALEAGLKAVIEKEPLITKYDTQVGDGDCGETLKNGAEAILKKAACDKEFQENLNDPVATLSVITEIVEDSMGGTSGGIYAIYLTSLVKNLLDLKNMDIKLVAQALKTALYDGLFKYTKARQGGRTLVDTLQPFVDEFAQSLDLKLLIEAAKRGCEETANLEAKFGRASYVSEADLKEDGGIPDPGAVGLLAIIEGFCSGY